MGGADGFVSSSLDEQGGAGVLSRFEEALAGTAQAGGDDGRLRQDNAADFIRLGRELPVDSGAALEADAIGDRCRDGDLVFSCDCRDHGKPILLDDRSIKECLGLMEILTDCCDVCTAANDLRFGKEED